MAKELRYVKSDITKAKHKLASIPEKPEEERLISRDEALSMFETEIESLHNKGYTVAEITGFLKNEGLPFTERQVSDMLKSLPSSPKVFEVKRLGSPKENKRKSSASKPKNVLQSNNGNNFVKPDTVDL